MDHMTIVALPGVLHYGLGDPYHIQKWQRSHGSFFRLTTQSAPF